MILSKIKNNFNSISSINIVFSFFPISFIMGNLITNINFFLFCCLGIFHLKSKILTNKINFVLKIIFLFFLLVLFSTSINFLESLYFGGYEKSDLSRLVKSILFFRFYLILLILYLLSNLNIINYRIFFIIAAVCPILVSSDVIFQYIFGFNVFGLETLGRHNSSFFGDELISGGYIQNFSFFSIFFLVHYIRKDNDFFKNTLIVFVICTLAIGTMLSGNRMPFNLFLLGLFLLFFFSINLRKILLISYFFIIVIFLLLISSNDVLKSHHYGYYAKIQKIAIDLPKRIKNVLLLSADKDKKSKIEQEWSDKEKDSSPKAPTFIGSAYDPEENPYRKIALTALETWKKNMIFGNGIKSFRFECHKIISEQKIGMCSNHPHNYYLEILVDLGIVGIISVIGIALIFIVFLVKNYKTLRTINNIQNLFLLAAIISLFLEVFPFKSSGSIFSTNNTTYLIILSSIILSYKKLLEGKNFS